MPRRVAARKVPRLDGSRLDPWSPAPVVRLSYSLLKSQDSPVVHFPVLSRTEISILAKLRLTCLVHRLIGASTAGLEAGDQNVVELDLEEGLPSLPSPRGPRVFDGEHAVADVLTGADGDHQDGRGLVDVLDDAEVGDLGLARSGPATITGGDGLLDVPGEREHLDLALVLVVGALAGDPVELEERVECHEGLLSYARKVKMNSTASRPAGRDGTCST